MRTVGESRALLLDEEIPSSSVGGDHRFIAGVGYLELAGAVSDHGCGEHVLV